MKIILLLALTSCDLPRSTPKPWSVSTTCIDKHRYFIYHNGINLGMANALTDDGKPVKCEKKNAQSN